MAARTHICRIPTYVRIMCEWASPKWIEKVRYCNQLYIHLRREMGNHKSFRLEIIDEYHILSNLLKKSTNRTNVGRFQAATVNLRSSTNDKILVSSLLPTPKPLCSSIYIYYCHYTKLLIICDVLSVQTISRY